MLKVLRERSKVKERGFSILEVLFGLVVFISLTVSFYFLFAAVSSSIENSKRRTNLERLGYAIKKTAKLLVDVYTPYCTRNIAAQGLTNLRWGWLHPNCSNVTLFPVLNGTQLTYQINKSVLSASDANLLKSEIRSYFNFCQVDTSTADRIVITCGDFVNLFYCTSQSGDCNNVTNLKTSVHTPGASYNYVDDKITALVVEYDELSRRGTVAISHRVGRTVEYEKPAFVDFGDFYREMEQKNFKKMVDIYNTLKKYETTKRVLEMKNTAPLGLSETDDYYVPWVYQLTAQDATKATEVCSDSNCTNLQNDTFWNRSLAKTDLYTFISKLTQYFLNGDQTYFVDAYGNPLGLELLVDFTACSKLYSPNDGSNSNNCIRIDRPPFPQKDYYSVFDKRPPFVGYVYSEFCYDLSINRYSACRLPIVYSN